MQIATTLAIQALQITVSLMSTDGAKTGYSTAPWKRLRKNVMIFNWHVNSCYAPELMKSSLDCIPCILQQSLRMARMATSEKSVHEAVLREALQHVSELDLNRPPLLGQWMNRLILEKTGQKDLYHLHKQQSNAHALALYPVWKQRILASPNPMESALKLAIAANCIDFGIQGNLRVEQIPFELEKSYKAPLRQNSTEIFSVVRKAGEILYLADNAGELIFDRLLIELLLPAKITVVVKGGPALNDALREDAEASGLPELVEVIDNGVDGAGTLLEVCSPEFRRRFEKADVVIAKGQANYETLEGINKDIFFLLKAKCPIVAAHTGCDLGSLVLHRSQFCSTTVVAQA
jgi:uncharacterized protein with ATP-grasp and redox domains